MLYGSEAKGKATGEQEQTQGELVAEKGTTGKVALPTWKTCRTLFSMLGTISGHAISVYTDPSLEAKVKIPADRNPAFTFMRTVPNTIQTSVVRSQVRDIGLSLGRSSTRK
jgi:hypothetical protein